MSLELRAKAELELRRRQTITTIKNDEELKAFVESAWGVYLPDVQVCADHSTPFRAFADAYFARTPVSVWLASRGFGGKSFLLSLLALTEAVTLKADVNVLGGSGEQSQRVLNHMLRFWNYDRAPRYLLATDPAKRETRLKGNVTIGALMASQASVRGPHPIRLRCDEIDEMKIDILDAAMGQPMSAHGVTAQTVMSSTRQYMDGTMTEILRRAGEKNWAVHTWCWRETLEPHGWLTSSDVEQKRSEVTKTMWDAEYENQEPNPASRAIQPGAVEKMFDKTLGIFMGELHQYIEIEPPRDRGVYITGADWARKQDFTEIVTLRLDVNPVRLVAFERTGRLDWPVMVERYNSRLRYYGGSGFHDGTGIGDVVDGFLSVPSTPIIMVGRERADMLTNYIAAIERHEIEAPFIRSLEAEHRYASVEDVYGGSSSHHLPDGIAAMALAWRGVSHRAVTDEELERVANGTVLQQTQEEVGLNSFPADLIEFMRQSGMKVD